jgi:hypothetical protein
MKTNFFAIVLAAAIGAAGCTSLEHKSSLTDPSAAGDSSLLGNWTSSTLIPTPSTCPGDLKFTGNAQGVLKSPTAIEWSAKGNATGPGLPSCAMSLTGTASIGTEAIIIPYAGDTCLGKVQGIETLKKH